MFSSVISDTFSKTLQLNKPGGNSSYFSLCCAKSVRCNQQLLQQWASLKPQRGNILRKYVTGWLVVLATEFSRNS